MWFDFTLSINDPNAIPLPAIILDGNGVKITRLPIRKCESITGMCEVLAAEDNGHGECLTVQVFLTPPLRVFSNDKELT